MVIGVGALWDLIALEPNVQERMRTCDVFVKEAMEWVLRRLPGVLGRLWGGLGRSRGGSGGGLGSSCGVLGSSWAVSGRSRGGLGAVLGQSCGGGRGAGKTNAFYLKFWHASERGGDEGGEGQKNVKNNVHSLHYSLFKAHKKKP